jgi:hypothetical protein
MTTTTGQKTKQTRNMHNAFVSIFIVSSRCYTAPQWYIIQGVSVVRTLFDVLECAGQIAKGVIERII